jgi:hypothetical protein
MKIGLIIALLALWLFATMTQINDKGNSMAAFFWKSVFFWAAISIAYTLGGM